MVSCRGDTQWHHVGRETICKRFPMEVIHHSFKSDGKLFAKGFLLRRCTIVSSRMGNYLRKVSCRGDTQWHHVGQETICKRFPVGVIHHSFMPDGKLFAKSFLLRRYTIVSSRTGNYLRKVSCWSDTPWFQTGRETICEKFPVEVIHNGIMSDGKLFAKGFLLEEMHHSFMPDGKLFAKGFLWR